MKKNYQDNAFADSQQTWSSDQKMETKTFVQELEMVRALIGKEHLLSARAVLRNLQPQNQQEESEVCLEEMRLSLVQGRWQQALTLSDQILCSSAVITPWLLACYQMRGQAFIAAGDPETAVLSLAKALDLATLFPEHRSAFLALESMVLALIQIGDLKTAEQYLRQLRDKVLSIEDLRQRLSHLLLLTRSEFHFQRANNDFHRSQEALLELKEISFWLGEEATFKKCIQDFQLFKHGDQRFAKSKSVHSFQGWIYLKRYHLVLGLIPKSVVSIERSEFAQKAFHVLSEGPVSEADFFKKIRDVEFDADLHARHLSFSLSSLRQFLPAHALIHQGNLISLK